MNRSIRAAIEDLEQQALAHPATQHALLGAIASAQVSRRDLGHILAAYVYYSRQFPEIVRVALDGWRGHQDVHACLEEVFLDEEGANGRPHWMMLQDCAHALALEFDEVRLAALASASRRYAQDLRETCMEHPLLALGALGPATETIVPSIYSSFLRWYDGMSLDLDRTYFTHHADHDERHAALLREAIFWAASTEPNGLELVRRGVSRTLTARLRLWDAFDTVVERRVAS